MAIPLPEPAPSGYGHEGIEDIIRARFGCESRWIKGWEVTVPDPAFVHVFSLIDCKEADRCFAIPVLRKGEGRGRDVYLCAVGHSARAPEDAVRMMRHERSGRR